MGYPPSVSLNIDQLKHIFKLVRSHHFELKKDLKLSYPTHKHAFELAKSRVEGNLGVLERLAEIIDNHLGEDDYMRTYNNMKEDL